MRVEVYHKSMGHKKVVKYNGEHRESYHFRPTGNDSVEPYGSVRKYDSSVLKALRNENITVEIQGHCNKCGKRLTSNLVTDTVFVKCCPEHGIVKERALGET